MNLRNAASFMIWAIMVNVLSSCIRKDHSLKIVIDLSISGNAKLVRGVAADDAGTGVPKIQLGYPADRACAWWRRSRSSEN